MADYDKLAKKLKQNKKKLKRRRNALIFLVLIFVISGLTGEDNWIDRISASRKAKREPMTIELVKEDLSDKEMLSFYCWATSELSNLFGETYESSYMDDGDLSTAWQEGESDFGHDVCINIELNNKEVPEYIVIYNGSHESEEKYYSNNRIKELVITIEDEETVVELEDVKEPQILKISGIGKTKGIKMQIKSVYEGSEYNDTAVSEIECY